VRPFRSFVLPLVVALLAVGNAHAKRIAIDDMAPGQWRLGKAASKKYLPAWRADAKKLGLSLTEYGRQVLAPNIADRKLAGWVDPAGTFHPTDMHHRITALQELERMTGVKFKIHSKVVKDYSGWSERAYAEDLYQRKLVYAGAAPRGLDREAAVDRLPKTFGALRNDPLRSTLDSAFERLGLAGSDFTPFIEFKVGRRLTQQGLYAKLRADGIIPKGARSIPADRALDKDVVGAVVDFMKQDPIRKYLEDKALKSSIRTHVHEVMR